MARSRSDSNRWSGALLDAWKVVDPTTTATVDQLRPPEKVPPARSGHPSERCRHPRNGGLGPSRCSSRHTPRMGSPARARLAVSHVPQQYYRLDAWSLTRASRTLDDPRDVGFRNIILSNHAPELFGIRALPRTHQMGGTNDHQRRRRCRALNPAIFRHSIEVADATSRPRGWSATTR